MNPQWWVPVLIIDEHALSEFLPIIEYIEETHFNEKSLFPNDPYLKYVKLDSYVKSLIVIYSLYRA